MTLTGSGAFNSATGSFEFSGSSAVGVLGNQNPIPSVKHDISINQVDVLQYRLDNGSWTDGSTYGGATVRVAQSMPVGPGRHTIEFRTVCRQNGVTSPVWSQTFDSGALPAVLLSETGGSTQVTEGGAKDTYTLVLTARPTANVVVTVTTGNQVQVTPTKLTFTTTNWNKPQTVTVNAVNDRLAEGPHTASLTHTISSTDAKYKNAKVPVVNVTITDDDLRVPALSISDVIVSEVDSGPSNATFVVNLSAASTQAVTVNYATANGSAIAGQDYQAITSSYAETVDGSAVAGEDFVARPPRTGFGFSPGETRKPFIVYVIGDTVPGENEFFYVRLSSPANGTIADGEAVGTIIADDPRVASVPMSWNFPAGGAVYLNVTSYWEDADSIGVPGRVNIANGKVDNQGSLSLVLQRDAK